MRFGNGPADLCMEERTGIAVADERDAVDPGRSAAPDASAGLGHLDYRLGLVGGTPSTVEEVPNDQQR